jgi:hypothetical protein
VTTVTCTFYKPISSLQTHLVNNTRADLLGSRPKTEVGDTSAGGGRRHERGRGCSSYERCRRPPTPRAREAASCVKRGSPADWRRTATGGQRCDPGGRPAAVRPRMPAAARAREASDQQRRDPGGQPVAVRAGDAWRGRVARGWPAGWRRHRRKTWEGKRT